MATSLTDERVNITSDQLLLLIPVTTLATNITYANVYCALCNGEKQVWFWNVKVKNNIFFDVALRPKLTKYKTGHFVFLI